MTRLDAAIEVRTSSGSLLSVPVRADVAEALYVRLGQALAEWGPSQTGELSAYALLGISVTAVEPDLRPPTGAQIKFALDIVRKLGVELPDGALQDRARMGAFLSKFEGRLSKRG